MFSDLTWKKSFGSRKWWGGGRGRLARPAPPPPPPPAPPPFLYSPGFFCLIFLDKLHFIALFDIIFFVVATQQALSWPFNRKAFLKSLFRSFCFLSTSHAIRFNMTQYVKFGVFQLTRFKSAPSHGLESTLNTPIFTLSICRGRSRDFEKGWRSISATMVGRQRKFQVSDGLKRPK